MEKHKFGSEGGDGWNVKVKSLSLKVSNSLIVLNMASINLTV
jgi:hypothetical protein